jgi:methylated-DNA-protein-cysteine methyltransferase-like protein
MEELWNLIRSIPVGKVTSYGALGEALIHPTNGHAVGRWMASCPEDVPWWRVVAKDGRLPIWKRNPAWEDQQVEILRSEGVEVESRRVDMQKWGVVV